MALTWKTVSLSVHIWLSCCKLQTNADCAVVIRSMHFQGLFTAHICSETFRAHSAIQTKFVCTFAARRLYAAHHSLSISNNIIRKTSCCCYYGLSMSVWTKIKCIFPSTSQSHWTFDSWIESCANPLPINN